MAVARVDVCQLDVCLPNNTGRLCNLCQTCSILNQTVEPMKNQQRWSSLGAMRFGRANIINTCRRNRRIRRRRRRAKRHNVDKSDVIFRGDITANVQPD